MGRHPQTGAALELRVGRVAAGQTRVTTLRR